MKTQITDLLKIKYPIILSSMSWISIPTMVASVSNSGGLGILSTNSLNIKKTCEFIKKVRKLTTKPFAVSINLTLPDVKEKTKIILEQKIPIVNLLLPFTSKNIKFLIKKVHEYNGKIIANIVNLKDALLAQDYGCDAIIAVGYEAAAYSSSITSLVLIPSLVDVLKIPVIASGGFADARGITAALALGASGIAMGTRFVLTKESPLHPKYKELISQKNVYDTIYSDRFEGNGFRIMHTFAAEKMLKKKLNPIKAIFNSYKIAKKLNIPYWKFFIKSFSYKWKNLRKHIVMANYFNAIFEATKFGNINNGILPIGQTIGLTNEEINIKKLINTIVNDFRLIQKKLQNIIKENNYV